MVFVICWGRLGVRDGGGGNEGWDGSDGIQEERLWHR